ncbi:site-2 protease family protein [Polynucleobacter kasalickyi]|uniref:Zn-dependent protease (Includes SpoIVFB) n=1 Tax=Polynucleobacter kasalickyi TaxID=1938817 RepID=A0A1W1Y3N9_9BURK|nr:site-2 protease family protein [Polynucleobacter kasalickyi]SMC30756.1 Zn-dependent protease (includes SpoIVFB) [Polynucleobacter kasalickyi]
MFPSWIYQLIIDAPPLILAITLHEAAHGYAAKHFGDYTAYSLGRVTLNPIKHIDVFGTFLIPLILKLSGSPFLFGYAKPVPVNFNALKNPKKDMIWVALAGPASNFIQAIGWALIFSLMLTVGADELLLQMAKAGIYWNLVLAAFNLFPIPPLDGGRILVGLLPRAVASKFARIEPVGIFIVIGLAMIGVLGQFWMNPLIDASYVIIKQFVF